MAKTVEQVLGEYQQSDVSVKMLTTLFATLPFAEPFVFYRDLAGAVQRVAPGTDLAQVQALAASESTGKALWVAGALDTSDQLIAGFAGVKNIFSLFGGGTKQASTFESDSEQATDAAVKGLGLAYMVYQLCPGDVAQKLALFRGLPAGRELAVYYAVGEIALPFADNIVQGTSDIIGQILSRNKAAMTEKFAKFAGADSVQQASGVLAGLTGPLGEYVGKAGAYLGPLQQKIKGVLPAAMNIADSVSGAAATGLDVLPVWSLLGARFAAEVSAVRAAGGK